MFSVHDAVALERWFRERGQNPLLLRSLRNEFFKRGRTRDEVLAILPAPLRPELAAAVEFHALDLERRRDSTADGASKLIFRTRAGFRIEAVVLRIASGRTALCVSSQIGCAARCEFCATGRMGMAHDLSAAEILDQLVLANQMLRAEGRRVRNVVFMGMGEPFHNEDAVHDAIDSLLAPHCFDHPGRYVVVSTVGVPDAMIRFARRFPRVRLALSLHSARETVRRRLVPVAARHDLATLREALIEITRGDDRRVMVEYLLLSGINDGAADLEALREYLAGLPVLINLIPYNPIDDAPELAPTPRAEREAFGAALRAAGFDVTLRHSLGADIAAACGQLVRRENRVVARRLSRSTPAAENISRGVAVTE